MQKRCSPKSGALELFWVKQLGNETINVFDNFDQETKKKLVVIWKSMEDGDQEHFINQVALCLSIWGSDEKGKQIAVDTVRALLDDGSKNLADFGIYAGQAGKTGAGEKTGQFKKAAGLLESYRFKHDLPSEPSKSFMPSMRPAPASR